MKGGGGGGEGRGRVSLHSLLKTIQVLSYLFFLPIFIDKLNQVG